MKRPSPPLRLRRSVKIEVDKPVDPADETRQAASQARLQKIGRWSRRIIIAAAVVGLAVAWGMTLFTKALDQNNSLEVARQFILEIQQYHSHKAYLLTSDQYHKTVKEEDFSNNFASDISQQLSSNSPQLFSTATPPGGKVDGREEIQYLFNVPGDGQHQNHEVGVLVVHNGNRWGVDAVNTAIGLAKHSPSPEGSPKQPAKPNTPIK